MKIDAFDSTTEERILIGMIVNNIVCGNIAERWVTGGLFRVRWMNLVGGWCVHYHRRYNKAPRGNIEGLFESWAERNTDKSTIDLVDRFLGSLSEGYEEEIDEINPDYLTDIAGEHFNAVQLEQMTEVIKGHIDRGDVTKAVETVSKWNKIEMGVGAGVDVLQDEKAVREAFEADTDALIRYPGALGQFFGNQLAREEFVAFTGATGKGKTWWLIDIAWMGIRQGRRVAFFEIGDMSQNQIMRRFMVRAAQHPIKPPYTFEVPVSITCENGEQVIETKTMKFDKPLDYRAAWAACEKRTRRHKKPLLRLSVHPSGGISAVGIAETLNVWERAGWVPDVVVIDYPDVMATMPGYQPGDREGINATWKSLRGLSQIRHILVVVVTQADAASYDAHIIRRGNFSDDRRKNDHVTGMYGINATEAESERGIFRINCTKRREETYAESVCLHVAGCLRLGRPHIVSTF